MPGSYNGVGEVLGGIPGLHLRHECHVRDFDDLPFFDAPVVFLTEDDLKSFDWDSAKFPKSTLKMAS